MGAHSPGARRDHNEDLHPRRLSRYAAHPSLFPEARRPRSHRLERQRARSRHARGAAERNRNPGPDPRADEDWCSTPRTPRQVEADQPAQRLSAHRHRRLHAARRDRVIEPASRHAVVCGLRVDLGADSCRSSANPATNGRSPGRQVADRRWWHAPRQDARDLRLRPDRQCGRRLRESIRHERAGLGTRRLACEGHRRRPRCGAQQGGLLRGVRRPLFAHATGGDHDWDRDGGGIWPA